MAGENARLASLATMAFAAAQHLPHQSAPLRTFGQQQLDWILGEPLQRLHAGGSRHQQPGIHRRYTPMRRGSATASPPASMTKTTWPLFQRRTRIGWIRTGAGEQWIPTPPGSPWPSPGRARKEATMIESGSKHHWHRESLDPPYRQPGLPWPSPGRSVQGRPHD